MGKTKRLIHALIITLISVYTLCSPSIVFAQQEPEFPEQQTDTLLNKPVIKYLLKNPSSWIQNNINKLNSSAILHPPSLDTAELSTN